MTITVGSATPTGTYPITVTGNGGGTQQTTTVTLTVTAPPNFTLTVSPVSLSIAQGHQGTSTVTTAISGGFNSSIALSASGMPTGASVSFNPAAIPAPGSGTSTMTITVGSATPAGTYPITVTGTGGGVQQNAVVDLTVTVSSGAISYVQGNYATPQSPQSSVTVTFTGAQVAGDLNVIAVGWNDSTATVSSVRDTEGNVYSCGRADNSEWNRIAIHLLRQEHRDGSGGSQRSYSKVHKRGRFTRHTHPRVRPSRSR